MPVTDAGPTLLCSRCAYDLSGLPESGDCPECALPIAASRAARDRIPPHDILTQIRDGARLAAVALVTPLVTIILGALLQSAFIVAIGFLLAAGLWTGGGCYTAALLDARAHITDATIQRCSLRTCFAIFGTSCGILALLALAASDMSGSLSLSLVLSTLAVFGLSGFLSWIFLFLTLDLFAEKSLNSRALSHACRWTAAAIVPAIIGIPVLFSSAFPILALLILLPVIALAVSVLLTVSIRAAELMKR